MKKSLIALAVLAASGAAMAQSSVTLYGVADVGITSTNNGATTTTAMTSGNLNGSRWGMRGTEDLGGGLKAIFDLQAGYNIDTGASASATSFFNRLSWVGLAGGFGTVKLGRQNNPVYANAGIFDSFGDALAGDSARLIGNNGTFGAGYNGNRTDNLITYNYSASGFTGEIQYGLGEVAGKSGAGRTVAGFASYSNGPIGAVLTFQNIRNVADTDTVKVILLGGNYNFGIAQVFAAVATEKNDVGSTLDQRDLHIGLKAPIGANGAAMVSYLKKDDKIVNLDASQVAVGYTHNLSKRTALYTSYGQVRNDSAASYGGAAAAGNTVKIFNAGVRHSF